VRILIFLIFFSQFDFRFFHSSNKPIIPPIPSEKFNTKHNEDSASHSSSSLPPIATTSTTLSKRIAPHSIQSNSAKLSDNDNDAICEIVEYSKEGNEQVIHSYTPPTVTNKEEEKKGFTMPTLSKYFYSTSTSTSTSNQSSNSMESSSSSSSSSSGSNSLRELLVQYPFFFSI